ncbi:16S rRNA (cytosine(1402)-N(4))-methyltransferase RsmH [Chlamydia psittaci]|uniref:16S rRNA (cytosine(1402)-N(4))-methyltransferase RsmH n=1 Tax=Chlamydia psittaci TaxID=83554 RepID=UPI00027E1480|nr:16S rRNA (cytosine(1402)-N(4))-methyltransferase RsmH [Chlamydia psittaci]EPJ24866.1 S-adenosyl-methyltransferase MraW [Chlamydia psittaci 09DC77]EPJ29717.1 S-adenosyl-methyltransferase MraW [Chlamydia psittaci 09DC78]EPL01061.1 S-adenosyl-methyltransferase MraW [Chlamydia psittaci 09DC79]AFS21811.1 S-adenosyl-methyltransferase MraW [Chlamydia psittaci MN]AFS26833.1 S-adenosyl-methyltransferase MraW [Chlamydia psittaci CP3]
MSATPSHIPVLVNECLSLFANRNPKFFCDVTVGAGGHAEAFLSEYPSIVSYDASDRDSAALSLAKERLEKFGDRVHFRHASFEDLSKDSKEHVYDGILADLGVSSMQLDNLSRGFSFQGDDHDLDMRMDVTKGITASEVLNTLREEELGKIFREYGEEPQWKNVASAVVHFRKRKKIITVRDLKDATAKVFPSYRLRKKIHPLTLIFQALRVYVNHEDLQLKVFLESAMRWLAPGGRLIIISFCSSEDRLVKWFFREAEKSGLGTILTKKVVMPTYEETRKNPRCRSAKLRCFEKKLL